jgi:hypothetical protein
MSSLALLGIPYLPPHFKLGHYQSAGTGSVSLYKFREGSP